MAISLDGTQPEFRQHAEQLIANLAARGIEMRPCAALRTPKEQAALWRQSRAREEIDAAIDRLRSQGGDFLADTLRDVGPQHGEHVTNALPGFSWHQWGEAIDCFWAVNGTAEWSTTRLVNGVNGYRVYAATASAFSLFAGGNWTNFKDFPHIQARKAGSPTAEGLTVSEINDTMRERFG
jgi:peptidoglycan LD-endopeptidase CwlK